MTKKKLFLILGILGLATITPYLSAMDGREAIEPYEIKMNEPKSLITFSNEQIQKHFNLNDEEFSKAIKFAELVISEYTDPKDVNEEYDLHYVQRILVYLPELLDKHFKAGMYEMEYGCEETVKRIKSDSNMLQFVEWYAHTKKLLPKWMNESKYYENPKELYQDYKTIEETGLMKIFKEVLGKEAQVFQFLKNEKENFKETKSLVGYNEEAIATYFNLNKEAFQQAKEYAFDVVGYFPAIESPYKNLFKLLNNNSRETFDCDLIQFNPKIFQFIEWYSHAFKILPNRMTNHKIYRNNDLSADLIMQPFAETGLLDSFKKVLEIKSNEFFQVEKLKQRINELSKKEIMEYFAWNEKELEQAEILTKKLVSSYLCDEDYYRCDCIIDLFNLVKKDFDVRDYEATDNISNFIKSDPSLMLLIEWMILVHIDKLQFPSWIEAEDFVNPQFLDQRKGIGNSELVEIFKKILCKKKAQRFLEWQQSNERLVGLNEKQIQERFSWTQEQFKKALGCANRLVFDYHYGINLQEESFTNDSLALLQLLGINYNLELQLNLYNTPIAVIHGLQSNRNLLEFIKWYVITKKSLPLCMFGANYVGKPEKLQNYIKSLGGPKKRKVFQEQTGKRIAIDYETEEIELLEIFKTVLKEEVQKLELKM